MILVKLTAWWLAVRRRCRDRSVCMSRRSTIPILCGVCVVLLLGELSITWCLSYLYTYLWNVSQFWGTSKFAFSCSVVWVVLGLVTGPLDGTLSRLSDLLTRSRRGNKMQLIKVIIHLQPRGNLVDECGREPLSNDRCIPGCSVLSHDQSVVILYSET